jgi:hypothetical protein
MTIDGPSLAEWVSKQHARGKHAMILVGRNTVDNKEVDCFKHEDVINAIRLEIPSAKPLGTVDLVVGDLWISVRPVLDKVPKGLMSMPNVGVCIIRE